MTFEGLNIEELRKLAREELRREYEKLREAKVRLWLSGKTLEEIRRKA